MTGGENITNITDFILLGFSDFPHIRAVLFVVFLVIYILTLTWNLCLIVLIKMDPHLHIPMYFFISNLPFIDICYVSSTAPKMLYDFFQEKPTITFVGCAIQYFVFSTMGLSESCLMTVMAYDRYAAICNPLLYSSIMSPTLYGQMVLGSYMAGLSGSLSQVCAMLQLHFCGPNVIHHFFCDSPPIFKLSCSNTHLYEMIVSTFAGVNMVGTLLVILTSYSYILFSILRMHSGEGRHKAFSTCASHLTALILFYSTAVYTYLKPTSSYSLNQDKVASVFYTVVIPMLNPLIYSLRNKDVKKALCNVITRKRVPSFLSMLA